MRPVVLSYLLCCAVGQCSVHPYYFSSYRLLLEIQVPYYFSSYYFLLEIQVPGFLRLADCCPSTGTHQLDLLAIDWCMSKLDTTCTSRLLCICRRPPQPTHCCYTDIGRNRLDVDTNQSINCCCSSWHRDCQAAKQSWSFVSFRFVSLLQRHMHRPREFCSPTV